VIGYFPGPIYDEQVSINSTLIVARVTTILLTGIFLLLITNTLDNELRLKFGNFYKYSLSYDVLLNRIPLLLFISAYALIFIHQGDLGLRISRSYIQKKLGGKYETEHFNIYYEKGSETDKDIELIAKDHEFRYYQLTKFFGFSDLSVELHLAPRMRLLRHFVPRNDSPFWGSLRAKRSNLLAMTFPHLILKNQFFNLYPKKKVGSYIYTSAEQKKRLMGAKYTEMEDSINREMYINYRNSFPHPTLKHELAHIFASEIHPIWKISLKIGLHEGVAVAADWDEEQLTPHQWSKAMKELKVAPPVEKIMGALWMNGGMEGWKREHGKAFETLKHET